MDINATIIGQSIAMIVFVWFCMKYIWPPLMEAIEERQTQIADGIAAGEQGRKRKVGRWPGVRGRTGERGEVLLLRQEA